MGEEPSLFKCFCAGRREPNMWEDRALWRMKLNFFKMHFVLQLNDIFISPTYATVYIWPSFLKHKKQDNNSLYFLWYVLDIAHSWKTKFASGLKWVRNEPDWRRVKNNCTESSRFVRASVRIKSPYYLPPVLGPFRFGIDYLRYDSINVFLWLTQFDSVMQ